jgi:heme iron utilization protein
MSAMSDVADEAIRAALEANPDGVLDEIARKAGAPLHAVLDALPGAAAASAPGARFVEIWADLTQWGPVTFIVHTEDGVFETKAALPPGSVGRGYFNIHGESPIGGHIRADRCGSIYFVDRSFFGCRSCSVWFMNKDGGAMFKVFVGRDEKRELIGDQLDRFGRLRAKEAGGCAA